MKNKQKPRVRQNETPQTIAMNGMALGIVQTPRGGPHKDKTVYNRQANKKALQQELKGSSVYIPMISPLNNCAIGIDNLWIYAKISA